MIRAPRLRSLAAVLALLTPASGAAAATATPDARVAYANSLDYAKALARAAPAKPAPPAQGGYYAHPAAAVAATRLSPAQGVHASASVASATPDPRPPGVDRSAATPVVSAAGVPPAAPGAYGYPAAPIATVATPSPGLYADAVAPAGPATRAMSEELNVGNGRLIRLRAPAAGVFIGDPSIADVQVRSPTLVYVLGKNLGETTLIAVDAHDATVANVAISVGYNLNQLRQELQRVAPDGDIQVTMANKAVVLTGAVGSAGDAETAKQIAARYVADPDNLVNLLRVDAPNQVNLRVRVVEVSRDIIKAFGINWQGLGQSGSWAVGAITGVGGITSNGATTFGSQVASQVPGLAGLTNIFAQYKAGSTTINSVIDALDSEGLVTVLAEPNITAVSGASANFLAGGEYPIPVPQGLGQVTIEFKKYGVSLESVATIVDGGRIHLTVKPEVSQLSTQGAITLNGVTIPALTTRRAETTVDLASGQSFAIAGLLSNNVNHTIQKVPGLGNIKVVAALFKSDRFERSETELLIIVTPYIVRPSSHRLAVPTDGYIAPTDPDRILTGADYTQARSTGRPAKATGPVTVVRP